MKTVVTGASGHVGANLVRLLVKQKRQVACLVRSTDAGLKGLPVTIVKGDVRDPASLVAAFMGAETVFHFAARISITRRDCAEVEAINVLGVRNVVEACLQDGVKRLVHFSSIHAFEQKPLSVQLDESRPHVSLLRAPRYDRSKAAGEKEVRAGMQKGLDAVILNPTAILGPNDFHASFFGRIIIQIARGRLPIGVDGGFDWVDVRDVAAAALAAEIKGEKGGQYLLSGHWVSLGEMANIIDGCCGKKRVRALSPLWLAAIGAPFAEWGARLLKREPLYTPVSIAALANSHKNISNEKASRAFGYSPRPFAETIRDTVGWYRDNGLLD